MSQSSTRRREKHWKDLMDQIDGIAGGTMFCKIKISDTLPPQYIFLYGARQLRIYYKGIRKQCSRCYEEGHFARKCESPSHKWLDYVAVCIQN
jgi:hypothetical protein